MTKPQRDKFDLYLSYSGRKTYLTCPKQYENKYVLKTKIPRDPKNSLFGSAIGKVFEWFYNRSLWKLSDPTTECLNAIPDAIEQVCRKEKFSIDENRQFISELRGKLNEFIPHGVETIRKNQLLSANSRAEVDLSIVSHSKEFGLSVNIGGYSDFIHTNDNKNFWILDGKASKYRDQYIDPQQLIWYAVQWYLKYQISPSRLGFIYWSFPDNPIDWIEFDEDSLRKNHRATFVVAGNILNNNFPVKVSKECKLCDFKDICPEGQEQIKILELESKTNRLNVIYDPDLIQI